MESAMGTEYPINTYDPEGSDPKNPGNSRFTINGGTITSGPAQDEKYKGQRFISVDNMEGKSTYIVPDTSDKSDSSSTSGWCFIATATLQGNYSESVLIPLKDWRYRIMESSRFGMYLSNNYRQFAPKIAYQISDMPKASEFLRKFFVFPAIKLSKNPGFVSNLLLWIIFFIGSISARILVFIKMRFF